MDHQQLGLILFAFFLLSPTISLGQDSTLNKVKAEVESVLETKESRYKRELAEADQKRKLEEDLRRQNDELEELAAQKRRLENQTRIYPKPASATRDSRIEVFVSSDCPDCLRTLGYLDALGVSYTLRELAPHTSAERDYLADIGRGVIPVVRVNGQFVRGYLPLEIRKLVSKQSSINVKTKSNGRQERQSIGAISEPAKISSPPEPELPVAKNSAPSSEEKANQFDVSGELKDQSPDNDEVDSELPNK